MIEEILMRPAPRWFYPAWIVTMILCLAAMAAIAFCVHEGRHPEATQQIESK